MDSLFAPIYYKEFDITYPWTALQIRDDAVKNSIEAYCRYKEENNKLRQIIANLMEGRSSKIVSLITNERALADAKLCFGQDAWVTWDGFVSEQPRTYKPYQVGSGLLTNNPRAWFGHGNSWEEAFEKART